MKTKLCILLLCLSVGTFSIQKAHGQLKMTPNGKVGVGTLYPSVQLHLQSYFYGSPPSALYGDSWQSMITLTNKYAVQNYVIRYANTDRFFITSMGKVKSYAYPVYGSDSTLKTDISDISNPITLIQSLHGVNFRWKSDTAAQHIDSFYAADTVRHMGFIAQEVRESMPGLVDSMNKGKLAVSYTEVIPLLVEGIKAQQDQLNSITESYSSCGTSSNFTAGGCAEFTKGDMLNATSRYLEATTDPSSDSKRQWISSTDNKSLKYWDNQGTPVKQTVEIQSHKDTANGYAGLNSSTKISGSEQTYGTTSNTACQGNDSRLSDARMGQINYYDNTTHSVSASTSEEVLAYAQIPANTLGSNDVIEVTATESNTINGNQKTLRLRLNTSSSISGSTTVANIAVTGTNAGISGYCRIVEKNSTSSQEINGPNQAWMAAGFSANAPMTTSLSTGSSIYLIITGQKSNSSDTMSLNNYQVRILKP